MKVILSRKGFDSGSGGCPNPILPDGSLLSLPIPSKAGTKKYQELNFGNNNLHELIHSLGKGRFRSKNRWHSLKPDTRCHLDPDLCEEVCQRPPLWKPVFGQQGSSQSHLTKMGVGLGDLFLFFGWFRQTWFTEQGIEYEPGTPDLHIIYGYLQVDRMIQSPEDLSDWQQDHPHFAAIKAGGSHDRLYVSRDSLSFATHRKGAGVFRHHPSLVLTKPGHKRSEWVLPRCFKGLQISYHDATSWKSDCFKSADRGQEFVIEECETVAEWAKGLVRENA